MHEDRLESPKIDNWDNIPCKAECDRVQIHSGHQLVLVPWLGIPRAVPHIFKDTLGGNEEVSTLFLVVFSVGVGLGSTFCNKLLKGKFTAKLFPFGCIGMTAATLLLYFFSLTVQKTVHLAGVTEFISRPGSWGIIFSFLMLAASGGIFSVPMYALMQSRSSDEHRARVIACLNITDSFGMVLSAVVVSALLMLNISVINIFLIIGVVNLMITPVLSRLARDENGK